MEGVAAACQVLLAVVLAVSGAAKALDPGGTRTAAGALGVPPTLTSATAVLLPVAELLTAVLLVSVPRLGLALSLTLLTAFTAAVGRTMASGRRPTCRCFGRLGGADVSAKTLLRNGVLLLVALTALLLGGGSITPVPALVGAALAAALLALEVVDGRRAEAAGLTALDDSLRQTTELPPFSAPLLGGGSVTRDGLLSTGRPLLLVVLSPGCGGCIAMLPELRRWQRDHGGALTLAVLGLTSPGFVEDLVGDLPVMTMVDEAGAVRDALGVSGTPAGLLVRPDGQRVGDVAYGPNGIAVLLEAGLQLADEVPREAAGLTLDDVATPVAGVHVTHTEDEGALVADPLTGAELHLDRLGALIWSVLDEHSPLAEIADDLAEAFDAPVQIVQHDVLALAQQLGAAGLLRGVRPVVQVPPPGAPPDAQGAAPG